MFRWLGKMIFGGKYGSPGYCLFVDRQRKMITERCKHTKHDPQYHAYCVLREESRIDDYWEAADEMFVGHEEWERLARGELNDFEREMLSSTMRLR
jgi:hypothetical protein